MEIFSLCKKSDIIKHRSDIESLFLECFGDRISSDLWEWAYISNPNGEPIVSLCYEDKRLVGHYAIVPIPVSSSVEVLHSYLSMTTMVASSFRKHGLFVQLAKENYIIAAQMGVDFVMGFPNAMSTLGFQKKLNWNMPPPDYVASVRKAQLLEPDIAAKLCSGRAYRLNLRDEVSRAWRMSKPGATYVWNDGALYKKFKDSIDLIYFDSVEALHGLPDSENINILLPHNFLEFIGNKVFDYQFGGHSINKFFDPETIERQMCLSDVF